MTARHNTNIINCGGLTSAPSRILLSARHVSRTYCARQRTNYVMNTPYKRIYWLYRKSLLKTTGGVWAALFVLVFLFETTKYDTIFYFFRSLKSPQVDKPSDKQPQSWPYVRRCSNSKNKVRGTPWLEKKIAVYYADLTRSNPGIRIAFRIRILRVARTTHRSVLAVAGPE